MTRAEAIEELEQRLSTLRIVGGTYVDCVNGKALEMAIEVLKQPERNKGRWIDVGDYCVCNQCWHTEQHHTNFCSKCGAKMEVEQC